MFKRPDVLMTAHDYLVLKVLSNQKLVALFCLAILAYMAVDDSEQPDILVGALVATLGQSVGSMTSFLTSTGGRKDEPMPVTGPDGGPVSVEDAGHASVDLLAALLVSFVGSLLALVFFRVLLGS